MKIMTLNWYLKHHHHNHYSLVEPYRENGKNRHRVIKHLGGLTHNKLIRGVIIIRTANVGRVTEFLEQHSAEYHVRVVELTGGIAK